MLLTNSMLGKIFSRQHHECFSYFSKKTGFNTSCKCKLGNLHEILKHHLILQNPHLSDNHHSAADSESFYKVETVDGFQPGTVVLVTRTRYPRLITIYICVSTSTSM